MLKYFYITTTLPYVNAPPHLGFALEIIQADAIARFKRAQGFEVFFNTGTDEHGLKIYHSALKEKLDPQKYCDIYAAKFSRLKEKLNLSYNSFIRTTDSYHIKAVHHFWRLCQERGDIYKKLYQRKYCVGCELEKTDSELVRGRCPIHPSQELELIKEENYFFRFSRYEKKLLELYRKNPDFVWPPKRNKEIVSFVKAGLRDFSVSRIKARLPWGIEVPGDETQVIYVWFDALINYISCLGWPENKENFEAFWPGIQVAGKDNLRQQSAMWQAMLMSAGLPSSRQIFIHGFITVNNQKMSKSLGNVVDPIALAEKYGSDALRYYLLREIPSTEDGDFTIEKFKERYNADLAKGLGNFAARVLSMIQKYNNNKIPISLKNFENHPLKTEKVWQDIEKAMASFKFNDALSVIWKFISTVDRYIDQQKPWQMAKEGKIEGLREVLWVLADSLRQIAWQIYPFLPATSLAIAKIMQIKELLEENPQFSKSSALLESKDLAVKTERQSFFPRLN